MSIWLGLLRKELLEIIRDPRALMAGLGLAFLAPLVIYGGMSYAINRATDTPPAYVTLVNADAAPNLVVALAQANIKPLEQAPAKALERWQAMAIEVRIPEDFRDALSSGEVADITITANLNEDPAGTVVRRIQGTIRGFAGVVAQRRLLMRGVDPAIVAPIDIHVHDTAPAENNLGRASMMLVIYVIMAAFFSALSSAIDTSAGERERNMLEVLLSQPVRTIDVVTAKLSGVVAVSMFGVALTLALSAIALSMVDLAKAGLSFSLSVTTSALALLAILPVSIFASALTLLVAFFSKTFKEAQSQVSLVIMVPAMLPMVMMFTDSAPGIINRLPITGQFVFIESLVKGELPALGDILIASTATLAAASLCVVLASRHLGSERSVNAL